MKTQPEIQEIMTFYMTTYLLLSNEDLESRMLKQSNVMYAIVATPKHLIEVELFFTIIEGIKQYGFYLKLLDGEYNEGINVATVIQSVSFEQSKSTNQMYDEGIKAAKEYLGSLHQGETLIELTFSPFEWRILNEDRDRKQGEYEKYVRSLHYKQDNVSIWQMPIEDAFPKILATVKSVFN